MGCTLMLSPPLQQPWFAAASSMCGLLSLPRRLPLPSTGKPCGNGWPMAGLITSPRLAKAFSAPGMEFFATGGEPDGGRG